jgi:hypothetical protein
MWFRYRREGSEVPRALEQPAVPGGYGAQRGARPSQARPVDHKKPKKPLSAVGTEYNLVGSVINM